MKKDINLLPWRAQLRRRKNKALLHKTITCTAICFGGWLTMDSLAAQHSETANKIHAELLQTQRELQFAQQQIQQFRNTHTLAEELQQIPKETIFSVLNQLTELPLTQGELTELALKQQHLILKGYSTNQEEFSGLNQFLAQQPLFAEVKLSEFKPQQHEMQFQFDLTLQVAP